MAAMRRSALATVLLHLAAPTLTTASGPLTVRIDDKPALETGRDAALERTPDWSYRYNELGDLVVLGDGVKEWVFAEWESGVLLED